MYFFFNDTATTEIYTLSLHDALPISLRQQRLRLVLEERECRVERHRWRNDSLDPYGIELLEFLQLARLRRRSEEHTSELQSRQYLVCRLLLEKKKQTKTLDSTSIHKK